MSKFLHQQPIILASGSAIRRKLLQSLGLEFSVVPSTCDEEAVKESFHSNNKIDLGYALAASKALEVSQRYPEQFIIAADQICLIGQTLLNKPLNHQTAIAQLSLLSGQQHQQIACLCIAQNNELLWQHHEIANVTLRHLSKQSIEAYLLSETPYQSCGAYQYETQGKWLFKEVNGCEDTILGLPLLPLTAALVNLGVVQF
ncbi:Maf family protein [Legionella drancourtii]|uniref:Nucleoside triphosphate pyrophosphatase n=1 Tax=Legionella drancourtii LLAP12 TaxID=658187 RepID=G9EIV7_9GAMM|nr:Maf family nucleotide pyrophosphatase [Legionella drancourtii]EHL32875.1 Maf-like protein [Legionella drancourtii LLAP12]